MMTAAQLRTALQSVPDDHEILISIPVKYIHDGIVVNKCVWRLRANGKQVILETEILDLGPR